MAILKQPNLINLSANLSNIVVDNVVTPVLFRLFKGADLIVEETYRPDADHIVTIKLKDLIHQLLAVSIPTFEDVLFNQVEAYADFKALVGVEEINFTVVKGGVDSELLDASDFLQSNFLTWQPQQKLVQYYDPEWLSYYAVEDSNVQLKAYFLDKTSEVVSIGSIPAGNLYSINLNFGQIREGFTKQLLYFDVWVEVEGVRKSFTQRYIVDAKEYEYNDIFLFENSIGGIDTVRFTGQLKYVDSYNTESSLIDDVSNEYFSEADRSLDKFTGYFRSERERLWALEFFSSIQRYHINDGIVQKVLVTKPTLESVKGHLNSYQFTFQPAKQTKLLNLPRTDDLPENIAIIGPDDEVFFLPPRLNEFPSLSSFDDALFPAQLTYSGEWRKYSFGSILQALNESIETSVRYPQFITLTGDQTFVYSNDINRTVDKESITLSATEHNFIGEPADRLWEYHNGAAWVQIPNTFNTLTYELRHDAAIWNGNDSVSVRYRVGELVDQMTIVKLYSGESVLSVVVSSVYGDHFFNGNIDTTLIATVFWGGDNITDTIPETGFTWTRVSADPLGDEEWNFHEGKARKTVDIDHTDVFKKAVFNCEVEVII